MQKRPQRLLVAAGGNLHLEGESPEITISRAIHRAESMGLTGIVVSRLYRTPCFPPGAGPDYVNAAFAADVPAELSPDAILSLLHRIEAEMGRTRETRWGMRTLDLDLIALGDAVLRMLDGEVTRQAMMIAYINDFYAMMWVTLAAIPLVLLMRPVTPPRQP